METCKIINAVRFYTLLTVQVGESSEMIFSKEEKYCVYDTTRDFNKKQY